MLRLLGRRRALGGDVGTNAPLAGFLQPLLAGDYKAAFRRAYTQAKVAETDAEYILWINAAAGAIRCADQCYNGRALRFIQYVNGTTETNPVAEMEEVEK